MAGSSSSFKPVVVRIKRKANQERLDAIWLEINERPLKKPSLELRDLSISENQDSKHYLHKVNQRDLNDSLTTKENQESRLRKILVQHIETISSSEGIKDVLQSFLPNAGNLEESRKKSEDRRSSLEQDKKQDQLRTTARQAHENLARDARFEQIWRSRRRGLDADDDSWQEICHLYDVVRVDGEQERPEREEHEKISYEDNAILCNYLPLLREYLPAAATEIESDVTANPSKEDNYVYDLYTVNDDMTEHDDADLAQYPRIQVDEDEEWYGGPSYSDYDSEDSNAENNPLFDYPDEEELSDKEDKETDDGSDEDSEDQQISGDEENEEDWRWGYR